MNQTPTPPTAPRSTMLVATDADHVHDEVAAALGGDHEVVRVHAGAEVLAAVTAHQPVLVVLDLQIGNMGGMAACLDLRLEQRADRIPAQRIVMLLDRDADAFLAHRAEADAWVVADVVEEVAEALGSNEFGGGPGHCIEGP